MMTLYNLGPPQGSPEAVPAAWLFLASYILGSCLPPPNTRSKARGDSDGHWEPVPGARLVSPLYQLLPVFSLPFYIACCRFTPERHIHIPSLSLPLP